MPWITSEDGALKLKLQGMTVTDANAPAGGRKVQVRYRLPDTALSKLSYPILIIEHGNVDLAEDRMHSGYVKLPYAPEGYSKWWAEGDSIDPLKSPYFTDFPLPFNLDYNITVMTRSSLHLQDIVRQLAHSSKLPPRYAYLEIPQDSTIRTLDVLAGPHLSYGKDNLGKRIHQATYYIRVYSELLVTPLLTSPRVREIRHNVDVYSQVADITVQSLMRETITRKSSDVEFTWDTNSRP